MMNSNTKDGFQMLTGPAGRRILAFGLIAVLAVPLGVGVLSGLLWGSSVAYPVMIIAFGVVSVAESARLMVRAERLAEEREETIRLERAASTASRALLKRDMADPVGTALGALIDGVDAEAVFLETNTNDDLDDHGNASTVRDLLYAAGPDGGPGRWELTGWRVGPSAREALESGLAFSTVIGDLDPLTNAAYRASQIGSEVLLPITAEGRWVGSVGFTSRKRDRHWTSEERHLLRATAEMIGAYWERRDAENKLQELLAAKDDFIASVSHEVRTPLTAVLGFADELDENIDKFSVEERTDLIGLIASQSREVANIVDDLLTAARAEAGTLVIAPQTISVKGLVGEVLSSHSGRVDFVMHDDLSVWADAGRVRQILRNLLTNAERYGGNIVKIHARRAADSVSLEVRDNGEGVPKKLRRHVFEPYARASNASTQPASVGLGLSVARRLAEMMDGELRLLEDDGWTVFELTLPVSAEAEGRPLPVAAAS
jgi:signal transduction histidine kinase